MNQLIKPKRKPIKLFFLNKGSTRSTLDNNATVESNNGNLSSSVFVSTKMDQGNNSSLNAQNISTSSEAAGGGDLASINASRLRNGGERGRSSATKVVINTNTESNL